MEKKKRTIFRLYIADCLKIKASSNKLILFVKMGNNNAMYSIDGKKVSGEKVTETESLSKFSA